MDPEHGQQPLVREQGRSLVHNGEIYNYRQLQETQGLGPAPTTSDSEVLLQLYNKHGPNFCHMLNGIFAFVIADESGPLMAARDHCGIKPLYMATCSATGQVWFSSELKSIVDQPCDHFCEFPDGHYWTPETGIVKWYSRDWDNDGYVGVGGTAEHGVRAALEKAVREQCMSDVPFGLLLSGGVDSAVVATILKPIMDELGKEYHTFCVGQPGSPDVTAAKLISESLGTTHHVHAFNPEEAFEAIPQVIYHLETYEPELIRSAIPNYFLAKLTSQHVKVVLTGEGSDELFAGYLYFHDAPDGQALHKELRRIFHHLHNVNNQRSDRMSMAWGVEARVPFLDPSVIDAVMRVDPVHKTVAGERKHEKHALRSLFDGEIVHEVLWRTKAMQCEGIGMTWVEKLQQMCHQAVSDEEWEGAAQRFPHNPPHTREEYYYRTIFEERFRGMDKFVHVWPGGCRAAGAAWGSAKYTRKGLSDVNQLANGLTGVAMPNGQKSGGGPQGASPSSPVAKQAHGFEDRMVSRGPLRGVR
jgi:asparagine synthase (glutamine-hydrolysing)